MVEFTCRCGSAITAAPSAAGQKIRCTACGQSMTVPKSATDLVVDEESIPIAEGAPPLAGVVHASPGPRSPQSSRPAITINPWMLVVGIATAVSLGAIVLAFGKSSKPDARSATDDAEVEKLRGTMRTL